MAVISTDAMKRVVLSTLAMSAALVVCTDAAASRGHHSHCAPPHARTIASDRYVRVYSIARKTPRQRHTYACLLRSGSTVALTRRIRNPSESIDHVALAGRIVAYTDSVFGVDTGSTDIVVVNVASRRTLLAIPGVGGYVDACVISFRKVTDLAVTDRGIVAWIVRAGSQCKTATFEVYGAQRSAGPALLAKGPSIAPGSVRVSNQTVSWENGGRRESANLP